MEAAERITVEVVYALPGEQRVFSAHIAAGSSVAAALRASGILERYPEIDLVHAKIGVFGRRVTRDTVVRTGDRIEIYRPLIAEPKTARRTRAERTGQGAGKKQDA